VVSICASGTSFIVFTQSGKIYDLSAPETPLFDVSKPLICGLSIKGLRFHVCCEDSSLLCLSETGEILSEAIGSGGYGKAVRLPQSLDILCKTTKKEVHLWSLLSGEQLCDFGVCDFKAKLTDLAGSPVLPVPISFDCKTGQVMAVLQNTLAKVYSVRGMPQLLECRKLLTALMERNARLCEFDPVGRLVWTGMAGKAMPPWTRFILVEKYEPKVDLASAL
jgi:hypothetical protein